MNVDTDKSLAILVTGASGFVGGHIVEAVKERWPWADVFGVDRRIDGPGGIDLCDTAELRGFVEALRLTHVVHASGGHAHLPDPVQWDMHVRATRSVIEALAANRQVIRWINIGSSSQYGRQDFERTPLLSEDHPDRPLSPYAKSKVEQERIVSEAAGRGGVDPVFLRLFNPIGVGQQPPFLVPNLVGQLLETRKGVLRLAIKNPGTVRDFVDVRDVARAVLDVIRLPAASGLKLNVCSGRATALSDLAGLLAGVAGRRCEIVAEDVDEAKIPYQCGSWRRIHESCGWAPRYALEKTLADVWQAATDSP